MRIKMSNEIEYNETIMKSSLSQLTNQAKNKTNNFIQNTQIFKVKHTVNVFKDGEILIATPEREFINNHQQVYIDLAKEADAGLYTCIAQNDQGTTSKNLYVSVLGKLYLLCFYVNRLTQSNVEMNSSIQIIDPPSMTQKFTDVEVKENETLTLKCPVKNPQMADIKWLKDGHSINNSLHFHVSLVFLCN